MLTVDANVWVAGIDVADPHHEASIRFLGSVQITGQPFLGPSLLILEVACAIVRRIGDPERALAASKPCTACRRSASLPMTKRWNRQH